MHFFFITTATAEMAILPFDDGVFMLEIIVYLYARRIRNTMTVRESPHVFEMDSKCQKELACTFYFWYRKKWRKNIPSRRAGIKSKFSCDLFSYGIVTHKELHYTPNFKNRLPRCPPKILPVVLTHQVIRTSKNYWTRSFFFLQDFSYISENGTNNHIKFWR